MTEAMQGIAGAVVIIGVLVALKICGYWISGREDS